MDMDTDGLAPAPEETAAPVTEAAEDSAQVETNEPEATAGDDDGGDDTASPEDGKKPAKGVQKRLDELTRRYHEERRDKERLLSLLERGAPQSEASAPAPIAQQGPPQESDFDDWDAFQRALTRYEVKQELAQERRQREYHGRAQTFQERANEARAQYPDFDSVVFDPAVPVTDLMREVILDSEKGPDLAYFLGTNLSEAQRIAALPPHRQAAELGRLEAKLSAPKQQPSTRTPPPPPPKTVSGISAGLNKSPADMSMAEYIAARKSGQL